jgi:hypothetical protein
MSDKWDTFVQTVLDGVKSLATGTLQGFLKQMQADASGFATQAKADIELWSQQLAKNQIDKDDFEANVQAEADLAKLAALTAAGIAAADLQRFRDGLVNVIVSAATKVLL